MFGPEGRPQHCCAWLGIASSFPECASPIVPEEVINKLMSLMLEMLCLTSSFLQVQNLKFIAIHISQHGDASLLLNAKNVLQYV